MKEQQPSERRGEDEKLRVGGEEPDSGQKHAPGEQDPEPRISQQRTRERPQSHEKQSGDGRTQCGLNMIHNLFGLSPGP